MTKQITLRIPQPHPGLQAHGSVFVFNSTKALYDLVEITSGHAGDTRPYRPGIFSYRFFVTGFGESAEFTLQAVDADGLVIATDDFKAPPPDGKTFRFEVT